MAQYINMIQWTGDNLKELVQFTGKSPKFDEWFKTWEEFENYVHTHNNIFKIFNSDGSHIEIPVGAWIVKTPDGYNVASRGVFKPKSIDYKEELKKCQENPLYFFDKYVKLKLKEQKPITWSEEDEKMLADACIMLDWYKGNNWWTAQYIKDWLKSLKRRITYQQNPKGSREEL